MSEAHQQRLVLAAQAGSPRAFDELLRRWERPLFRHARRMLASDDEAYDALQQAFLAIVRSIRSLRRREQFRPWAYGVVTRVCLKARARRGEAEEVEERLPDDAPSPELLAAASERRESLLAEVLTLSPRVRSVVLLHFYEGLSLPEVAAALDIELGTVKSRLGAGLQKLRSNEEVQDHA
ncbi:MAG: sigma-70 family RNA polymerase sigma factor [Deltaproteobacteria bacterium]|nr:sigma-70 family RNA polymerase sigma factor [Deltaproteobacteria bacterium]